MTIRLRLTPMTWFIILTVIAIGVALGLPPNPHAVAQLHTTATAYRLAVASLLVPYVLIWFTAFYAYAKLQEYSRLIKGTKDGIAFRKIAIGMGALAFSLVVPTIISLVLNNVATHNPSFKTASVIINNYLSLFPGMFAFLLLLGGSRALLRLAPGGVQKLDLRWYVPFFLLLSVVFSHLTIENQYNSDPYHLGVWLLVITFIVPYLYGWTVGLMSAYELRWYAKTVKGSLYRQAVRQFANGIAVVILASIAIQFANITIAQRIKHSLSSVLLVDYGLLIILATGLIIMALSTKKLKLMEQT